jgi:hypothetical protein
MNVADDFAEGFIGDVVDFLRDKFLGALGDLNLMGLPIGGILGAAVGYLWPEADDSHEQWEKVRQYAETLIHQIVDAERIERLNESLEGLKNLANDYRRAVDAPGKGAYLVALLGALRTLEIEFWDERNPEQMFPLFSRFGTLWISALAEHVFYYEQGFGKPPSAAEAANNLKMLQEEVAKYTAASQKMFDNLYAWRFRQLQMTWQDDTNCVIDKYDDFNAVISGTQIVPYIADAYSDRASWIMGNFVADLQSLLAVTHIWKDLEQPHGLRLLKTPKIETEGPWGGYLPSPRFEDSPPVSSRITRIELRAGAYVDCLEIFYDGKSGGAHGNASGGVLHALDLEPDEFIDQVSGHSGPSFVIGVQQLNFHTNKGRVLEAGNPGRGEYFISSGRGRQGVQLSAIAGRADAGSLTGLVLKWKHPSNTSDYVPAYKRDGKPLLLNSTLVRMKAENGLYLSHCVEEYSWKAASKEYFPKMGSEPVGLQFVSSIQAQGTPAASQEISDHQRVRIVTTEAAAGEYTTLSKYADPQTYYYTEDLHENKQVWETIKQIPSSGPVLVGEKIFLRHVLELGYLYAGEDNYVGIRPEPYTWETEVHPK